MRRRNAHADSDGKPDSDANTNGDADRSRNGITHAYLHTGCVAAGGEHADRSVWSGRRFGRHLLLFSWGLLLQFGDHPSRGEPFQPG